MYARVTTTETHAGLPARLLAWIGPKGLLLWALLLVALSIFAAGLVELVSGLQFGFILLVVFVAMTTGWLLGVLPLRGWLVTLLGLTFGAEFILTRVGRLGDEMADIVRAAFAFIGQLFAWIWERLLYLASYSFKTGEFGLTPVRGVDWMLVPDAFGALWAGMGTLLSRAYKWLAAIFSGAGTYDPVGTVLVWGFVTWLCALWAGWWVSHKRQTVIGILPAGFLLSFLLAYTYAPSGILLPFLGVLLILLALTAHRERELHWTRVNIDFSRDLWTELTMVTIGVSLLLVLASATLPAFSYRKLADWISELTASKEEEPPSPAVDIAKSFGVEQRPLSEPARPAQRLLRSTDLPRRHLIGSGPELSRIVAFVVSTGEIPPLPDEPYIDTELMNITIPRHYWRSLTYDRYFGQGWATSATELLTYKAGELFLDPEVVSHTRVLRQEVRIIGELGGMVYIDGQFVSMDQDYDVSARPPGEIFAVTAEARTYRADSLVPVYTVEALRAEGSDYPEWIRERYLQLPETTPERVRVLARDLTATQPTPYDRAVAIESYLREFPYTLDVPKPPAMADIADYFLFELKKGYCDYYATAMVVLARAAGLPARLVIGYTTGSYDITNARYIVTEANAHAWVEIYFPTYGWIEFEPTGGVAPIYRPHESNDSLIWPEADRPRYEPLVPPQGAKSSARTLLWQWLLIAVAAVAFILVGASGVDSALLLLRRTPEAMASLLYERLRQAARRLQVVMHPGDTPYELGQALVTRVLEVAQSRHDDDLLPPAEDEIPALVEFYVRAWYSPHTLGNAERRAAVWAWWKLQWRLELARLWRRRHKARASLPALGQPSQV
ncbi:MAG TPA: transglutaminase domain-containing protein [Anaerolineae bacterium]|nr:transglutaminase domain-containing protein [Anaerolineae bacterium]HQK13480.1 transglutaminase domain-containing protein [Anaerolineae bacterium]